MATGYQGYAGYGTDEAKAKRIRGMADLLTQQSVQDRFAPVQHWTQGLGRMAEALAANNLSSQADQAETAYADGRKRITDTLISQMYPDAQGVAKQDLAAPAAFDLTPAGMEQRQAQGGQGDKVRNLAQLLGGDPLAAIEFNEKMKPPAPEPMSEFQRATLAKPQVVNNRVIDPNDPTKVIADYSDTAEKPPWTGAVKDASGNWVTSDAYIKGQLAMNPQRADSGGMSPDLAYRMGRDQLKDAQEAEAAKTKARNATSSLGEGIGLVNQLVSHPGFKTIYGVQGALPVFPGTEGADAVAMLEQIGGQAFLAGVETMRGTGPLSDNEGKKVAAARTRLLNRGQSPEAAARAAQEFTSSMQRLLAAYEKESGISGQPAAQQAGDEGDDEDFFDSLFGNLAQMTGAAQGAPPPGVSPEMWAVMDDEDKAAFR